MGTVVIEAREKSSAKITASFVVEQNREVFALPESVYSCASSGNNSLIARQHAKLISSATNILEELSIFSSSINQLPFDFETTQSGLNKINLVYLNEIQKKIVLVMNEGVGVIDAIHSQTIIEMNILLATLLELELAGKVDILGGQIYRLAVELDLSTNENL